jgi:hypothetical protein
VGDDQQYEIALGPAAVQVISKMRMEMRKRLAEALRTELDLPDAIVTDKRFGDVECRGIVLSTGHLALYNPLTAQELTRMSPDRGRRRRGVHGFYIFDILYPGQALLRASPHY